MRHDDVPRGTYGRAWGEVRLLKLSRNPLCQVRLKCDKLPLSRQRATEVHHVHPVRERPDLRLVWENLRSVCKACHRALTVLERAGQGWREPIPMTDEAGAIG